MEPVPILVIDRDPSQAAAVSEGLREAGYDPVLAASGTEGLHLLDQHDHIDLVFCDLDLPDMDGLEVLKSAKRKRSDIEVVIATELASVEKAVEVMREGAADFLRKPVGARELRTRLGKILDKQRLQRHNVELQRQIDSKYGYGGLIGTSQPMQRLCGILQQVAPTHATVLIAGESGTGKELVARALHANSPRRHRPFVPINCAALSEGILESELFGHEKGAFTGALHSRKGRFEFAHGGTVFLDEIGDMPPATQVKLLRVIENGEIVRLGRNAPITVDVRILAATNRDMRALVREGTFREDLYYRLKVVTLVLPPLRERQSDVGLLIDHFLGVLNATHRREVRDIAPEARSLLYRYSWPGNVRELKNCIESMVVMARGPVINVGDVPGYIRERCQNGETDHLQELSGITIEAVEQELIRNTLQRVAGNYDEASRILGISKRTLYRKIKAPDTRRQG
jgi:two-component system response regulator HydG